MKTVPSHGVLDIFVSPLGRDAWSGALARPNRLGTDGPLATVSAGLKMARRLRQAKGSHQEIRIVLRGGVYYLKSPVHICSKDSGIQHRGTVTRYPDDPACPLTIAAYPGETPVLSGGAAHYRMARDIREWEKGMGDFSSGRQTRLLEFPAIVDQRRTPLPAAATA